MTDLSYVRTEMLPEQTPPITEKGLIKWARENLFSNIPNTILTLLAIYFIYTLLAGILPWVFQSSWTATSLNACRESIAHTYGEGVEGACWAVIRERYLQLLFGFYPSELYWRPVLAFALMLVAVAPVLYNGLPRKMLWFSGLYPFLAFWLFWGGTVWLPLSVIAGFVIAYLAMTLLPKVIGSLGAVIAAILLPVIWWLMLAGPAVDMLDRISAGPLTQSYITSTEADIAYYQTQLDSGTLTPGEATNADNLKNSAIRNLENARNLDELKADVVQLKTDAEAMRAALPDSVRGSASLDDVAGGVTGADKAALEAVLDAEANYENGKSGLQNVYAEVGRIGFTPVESAQFGGFMLSIVIGVTGIVLSLPLGILLALGRQSDLLIVKSICVGFIEFIRGVPLITLLFVASTLLNYFLPPGTTFDIILRVMIMVTLFSAAYMAEVVRGGLAALPTGQYEAADALGLDYWKSMRLIIMPQALKISIPSIVGIFIGLFKDTVLVSIIGLMDPLGLSNAIRADANWNGIVWELYGFIALMFFIVCFSMGRYAMYLERKLQTGH